MAERLYYACDDEVDFSITFLVKKLFCATKAFEQLRLGLILREFEYLHYRYSPLMSSIYLFLGLTYFWNYWVYSPRSGSLNVPLSQYHESTSHPNHTPPPSQLQLYLPNHPLSNHHLNPRTIWSWCVIPFALISHCHVWSLRPSLLYVVDIDVEGLSTAAKAAIS